MPAKKNQGNPDGELLTADFTIACPYCGEEETWALADRKSQDDKYRRWKLYATSREGVCKKANYWLSVLDKNGRLSKDRDGSDLNKQRPELFDRVALFAAGKDATAETLAPDEEADPYGERVQNQNRVTPLQGWNRLILHMRLNAAQKFRFIGWGPEYTLDIDSATAKRGRNAMRDINAMHGLKTTDADFELVAKACATPRRDPVYSAVAGKPTEEELAKVEVPAEYEHPLALEATLHNFYCKYFDCNPEDRAEAIRHQGVVEANAALIRKAAGIDSEVAADIIAQAPDHRPYSNEWAAGMLDAATGDGDGPGVSFEPVSEPEVDTEALTALL